MSNNAGNSSLDKAIPALRVDELNEDSSRYDHVAAAPPDEELVKYWYSWAVLAFVNGLFSFIVFLSIITNKKVRGKPFNLYLIYLMIPDFVFSLLCTMTCLLNAINGAYWSHFMCNFQQFYVVFGIGANAWLNCVVAYQLHMILRNSKIGRRYKLPTRRRVTIQAVTVYLWCSFLGSWGIYEADNFPFHSGQVSGLACLPIEGRDKNSLIFFWVCFFPLFVGIPIAFVVGICWDILFRKLMPPPGRRRLFMIYFGRLITVFLIMWIPCMLILFILAAPHWVDFLGGSWSHLQGGVSAFLILLKPDIWEAFKEFITCHCHEDENSQQFGSGMFGSGMFSSGVRGSYWWPRRSADKVPTSSEIVDYCVDLEDDLEDYTPRDESGLEIIQQNDLSSQRSDTRIKAESTLERCDHDDHLNVLNG
jgi:hypothetical protein